MSDLPDWQTQVQEVSAVYIRSDGTVPFTADESMGGQKLTNVGTPAADSDADTKGARNTALSAYLPLAGGTMVGEIAMGTNKITGLAAPAAANDAARKTDVDTVSARLDDIAVAATAFALDTIYQNTSGKLLLQTVTVVCADGDQVSFQMASSTPPTTVRGRMSQQGATTVRIPFTIIVPPGWYYRLATVAGSPTMSTYTDEQLL